ncbi:unnamed protein product [Cylicocyclus nassatus]|uniref:Uncharacterized protein n=1 Tax=Cylicocyclus nassatus TaxID=53992 RepID=A0AA36MDA8_CYLNA|nr:unnamed protein product [Cylicocyclus nassatus]
MAQLGKDLLPKLDTNSRQQFLRCLNAITDKRDVVSAAKCLIEAKENYEEKKTQGSFAAEPFTVTKENHEREDAKSFAVAGKRIRPLASKKLLFSKRITFSSANGLPNFLILSRNNGKREYKNLLRKKYKKRLENAEEHLRRYRTRRAKRSPHRLVIDEISKSDTNGFQASSFCPDNV